MRWLYNVVYAIGFVLLTPSFLYKMWKRGKYRANFGQRFGRYAPELRKRLATKTRPRWWIQAVSVGEVNVALALIAELRRRLPDHEVVVTTTTSTGYVLAQERLPADVALLYFPQDFPCVVRRAFDLIQPDRLVLMEQELWPNVIWTAARRGVPVAVVNARMSPASARAYRRLRWFFRRVLSDVALVCAQAQDDANHYIAAGAPADRVHVVGNMKFDLSTPPAGVAPVDCAGVLRTAGVQPDQPVLVAGSTHPGEEEILFDLLGRLRKRHPGLFLVVVPRHVERTPEIVALAQRKGIRTCLRTAPAPADCLIVNTTGELRWFYEVATVIFVGKSLVGRGGQNIIEAAAAGRPVLFGPHMQNFKAIAEQFLAAGAAVQVHDAAELERAVDELLSDASKRARLVAAAKRVIADNLGATARTVALLVQLAP